MIYFGAIPVRVGDSIMRAGSDQQLTLMIRISSSRRAKRVVIERESAFEAACHMRIALLPATPFRQWRNFWQVITNRQTLQQDVGQRRGRFTDGKTRMLIFFQQNYRAPQLVSNHGQQAAAKARTHYGNVVSFVQFAESQLSQRIGARLICDRFILRRREIRGARQAKHAGIVSASHKSAKTRPRFKPRP